MGAAEYLPEFLHAGYDLAFIASAGVTDEDLDCIGLPRSKLGIRKKIIALHNLSEYYDGEGADEEEAEDEDDDGDGEDEDEAEEGEDEEAEDDEDE